ncbi:MAG: hypothetical protein N3A56_00805 [Thermodesulfobacteriaceae bacterium]|nr:hypothetical protein [Thermodesulfobacteriaceae bacterium]
MSSVWIIKPTKKIDTFTGFKFDKNFKSYQQIQEIEASQLKNQRIYLILEPNLFHLEVVEVPGKIPAFIQVQAESRVKEMGLFLTPPKVIYKTLETLENSSKIFIFGMEEKVINSYMEILKKNLARVELVTHKLLSIFSWLKKNISQREPLFPILLILAEKGGTWFLVSSEKAPLYAKFSAVDEFLGLSPQAILEDTLTLRDYTSRFLGEGIKSLIILGEEKEKLFSVVNFQEALNLPLIDFKNDEFERYPEIFGTIYLEETFNFLPLLEKLFFKELNLVERLTPFFLILMSLSLVSGYFFYQKNLELEKKINTEVSYLKSLAENVSYMLSEDSLKKIKTYLDLEKQKRNLLRIDELLVWLSQNWDKDFIFKDLKLTPKDNETYVISITFEIKGDWANHQIRVDKFIKEVNQKYNLQKSNFEFLEKEKRILVNLELLSKR